MNITIFLILGIFTTLLFPPYFIYPLGFVIFTYICFYIEKNIQDLNFIKLFIHAFFFSFSFFGSLLFWMGNPFLIYEETSNLFILPIFFIFFIGILFSIIFAVFIKYNKVVPIFFLVPLIFISFEIVISILLYGFPWISFSLIISNKDYLLFNFKIFGTLITSYIVIQLFCLPYLFLSTNYLKLKYSLIFIFPIFFALIAQVNINDHNTNKNTFINVEIFQTNFQINDSSYENKLSYLIENIKRSNADLIIFSENNYPYIIQNLKIDKIQNIIKDNQTVIIGGTRKENEEYFNSLLNITNSEIKHFDKKILVPFGEFLPFRNLLSFFYPISGDYDFTSGKNQRIISYTNNLSYIPIICYEIIFYWKLIDDFNYAGNFMVNITNDIWFGDYLGPYQHFYHAKIRAAEFNKPIIRVSNNGISAIIDNKGKILSKILLNEQSSINIIFQTSKNESLYKLHIILNIYLIGILIFLILFNIKKNYE